MFKGLQKRELLCMHQYLAGLLCSCLQVYQAVYLPSVLCLRLQVCVMNAAYCLTSYMFCVHPPKAALHALLPQVVGVYGDLDLGVSLSHEDAFRMVVCLRKQQEPQAGG
jgi:hypothetical protein